VLLHVQHGYLAGLAAHRADSAPMAALPEVHELSVWQVDDGER